MSDEDIQASAAANMVAARNGISDINAAINNTTSMNDNSGILERLTGVESRATNLEAWDVAFNYTPAACYDSVDAAHYVFVTGTNRKLYRKMYSNGAWGTSWTLTAHTGDYWTSGPAIYYLAGYIHIYIAGTSGVMYHALFNCESGVLGTWENMGGIAGP